MNTWWGIRSFLAHHGVPPARTPKRKPNSSDEEDGSETVPTVPQLGAIRSVLSARGRAIALLMASSGVRAGVLATRFGPADGLRLKHLPDLRLTPDPHFEVTPFLVRVPPHLAKGSTVSRPRGYITFGTQEAAEAIESYLKSRLAAGEPLSPDSALAAPDGRGRKSSRTSRDGVRFMARKALAFTLKSAMDRVKPPGVHWHAHTLRAWFSSQLDSAEAKGLISRSRREFFMGHAGRGVDFAYNLDRPKHTDKIEELREAYRRCEGFLSTIPAKGDQYHQARIAKVMLMGLGYSEEELASVDFDDLDVANFQDLVTRRLSPGGSAAKQKLVDSTELPSYLEKGWTVVTAVNGHQVVLSPPNSR